MLRGQSKYLNICAYPLAIVMALFYQDRNNSHEDNSVVHSLMQASYPLDVYCSIHYPISIQRPAKRSRTFEPIINTGAHSGDNDDDYNAI